MIYTEKMFDDCKDGNGKGEIRMAREKRERKGGGGKILSFFLGMLMGIIVIVGSLAGVGYYVYKRPVGSTLEKIDSIANTHLYAKLFGDVESAGILSADYADKTVGEMIGDLKDVLSAVKGGGTLADLSETFPIIDEQMDTVLKQLPAVLQSVLTKDDLMTSSLTDLRKTLEDKLYAAPLHTLLDLKNKPQEEQDSVLLALCFGEQGVDWDYDDVGEIQMLNGATETTISTLKEGTGLSELLYRLSLHSLLGKDLNLNDDIMRTLAFGPKTHYTPIYDTDDATKIVDVEMKEVVYNYKELVAGEEYKLYDVDGNEIAAYDEATKVGYDIATQTVTLDSGEIHYLDVSDPAEYKAYTTTEKTERAHYKKTTVKDLTQKASSLIDGVELGSVLNVNNESHKVLIALAYGSEENYTVDEETGKITPKNSDAPRTVGDLKKDSKNIINDVLLGDALDVKPDSHKILIALAYGKEDVDYEIVDENGTQKIKPKTDDGAKAPSTIGDLTTNSNELINGIYLKDALTINASSHKVLISLAYGNDYTIVGDKIVGGTPRTLKDLSENSTALINDIRLSDVLDEKQDSAITMYLLYGKEGIHYEINEGKTKLLPERILVCNEKVYNAYGEELAGYSVSETTLTIASSEGTITKPLQLQNSTQTITAGDANVYYILKDENVTDGDDIYVLYEPTTIGSLNADGTISNINSRLTLGELVGDVSTNKFLKHLEDTTIDKLPNAIENLTVQQVFEDEIYLTATSDDTDSKGHAVNKGDYIDEQGDFVCTAEDFHTLTQEDKRKTIAYTGTWKYLLTAADGSKPEYTLTEMDKLVTNMTANMQNATLTQLNTDGIISLSSDTLGTELVKSINLGTSGTLWVEGCYDDSDTPDIDERESYADKTFLGELTVSEILTYVGNVLTTMNEIPNKLNPSTPPSTP